MLAEGLLSLVEDEEASCSLSLGRQNNIICALKQGRSNRAIAASHGVSKGTIKRVKGNFRVKCAKKPAGRPRKLSKASERRLVQAVETGVCSDAVSAHKSSADSQQECNFEKDHRKNTSKAWFEGAYHT